MKNPSNQEIRKIQKGRFGRQFHRTIKDYHFPIQSSQVGKESKLFELLRKEPKKRKNPI